MFYLMMHSTHFICYGYMESRHIVKDHSDIGRGRKEMFYLMTHSTLLFVTVIWRHTYGKGPLR